jgi:hypothetical protein
MPVAAEQSVGGDGARGEKLLGLLGSCDGQAGVVQQSHLDQQAGLIPVDVLVGELAVPEACYHAHSQPHQPAGGRHAGKHVVHGDVVGEGDHKLVHHLAGADSPGDLLPGGICGPVPDEDPLVEGADLLLADPPVRTGTWLR